jgi:hypothetical protein
MAESTRITCDVCFEPVSKSHRTKVRFSPQPERRAPLDVCSTCMEKTLENWGKLARSMFPPEPVDAPRSEMKAAFSGRPE